MFNNQREPHNISDELINYLIELGVNSNKIDNLKKQLSEKLVSKKIMELLIRIHFLKSQLIGLNNREYSTYSGRIYNYIDKILIQLNNLL